MDLIQLCQNAVDAKQDIQKLSAEEKNQALRLPIH